MRRGLHVIDQHSPAVLRTGRKGLKAKTVSPNGVPWTGIRTELSSCCRVAAWPPAAVSPLRHEHYVAAWFASVGAVLRRSPQRFD